MKNILFYIDNWFFHFGIAKYMQEKTKDNLYAVIDTDEKSKSFYENQQLVNFKKKWFLSDPSFPVNTKPDLSYLKKFEEKYKINLWKLAYSDRVFYKYNIHHKFSHDEILSLLEQKCRFYEDIFQEGIPDFFFTFLTVSYHHVLLYEMCKALGTKILMLQPIKFGNRMTISSNSTSFDLMPNNNNNSKLEIHSFEELRTYLKKFDTYDQTNELMKDSFESRTIERYKSNFLFFIRFWDNDYQKNYLNFNRNRHKIFLEKIFRSKQRKTRQSFLNKNCVTNLKLCKPYVYFPLHYEPERILLIDAPFYDDQLSIIKSIAKSLPINYTLCVKEHFMMKTLGWRDLSFYHEIINLPNVKLLHPSLSPEEIIQESSLVLTIAGTTGQEAAFYNKPSIVFVEQPYSVLSSVYTLKNITELPEAIKSSLQLKVSLDELINYVDLVEKNSFEFHWRPISNEFAFKFGFKGPVMTTELPDEKIKEFLDKYSHEFKVLTNEHLKKLNSF